MTRDWFWILVLAGLFSSASARAGEDPGVLANKAMELFEDPETRDEALGLFHRALSGATGEVRVQILGNLGKAYGSLERYPEAWAYLDAAIQDGGAGKLEDARAFVEKKLEEKHVRVLIKTDPPDGELIFEGEGGPFRFPAPAGWWFEPGHHTVQIERAGIPARKAVLNVSPKAKGASPLLYRLTLKTKSGLPVKDLAPEEQTVDTVPLKTPVPAWKWGLMGGGLAVAAGGVATWMVGWDRGKRLNDKYSVEVAPGQKSGESRDFNRKWDNQVVPMQTASYVLWGLGGAAAVTGLVLALVHEPVGPGSEDGPQSSVPSIVPVPLAGGGGVSIGLTFD